MPDLDMTPYAGFVWGAYGISAAMLLALTWIISARAISSARRLARLEADR